MADYDFNPLPNPVESAVVSLIEGFKATTVTVESAVVSLIEGFKATTTVEYISIGSDGSSGSGVLIRTIPALVRVTQ